MRVFRLSKMLLDLMLFCCFLCIFPIRECFVLPKFVFCHEFGLYCFCCALSRSCRYHSKFRRFKPICFLVLFVLVVEMHHSVLPCSIVTKPGRNNKLSDPIDGKKNPSGDNAWPFSISGRNTDDLRGIAFVSAESTKVLSHLSTLM